METCGSTFTLQPEAEAVHMDCELPKGHERHRSGDSSWGEEPDSHRWDDFSSVVVYVTIGNSDDKLPQSEWSEFWNSTDDSIRLHASQVHGAWASIPTSQYQNACWCFEIDVEDLPLLRGDLARVARIFKQDSIVLARTTVEHVIGKRN